MHNHVTDITSNKNYTTAKHKIAQEGPVANMTFHSHFFVGGRFYGAKRRII